MLVVNWYIGIMLPRTEHAEEIKRDNNILDNILIINIRDIRRVFRPNKS